MNNLTKKMISMFVIIVVLLVGIGMISSLINERMYLKSSVEEDIAKISVRSQTLAGPVITVPYSVTTYDSDRKVYVQSHEALYFFPDQLSIVGDLTTEERYRAVKYAILFIGLTFAGFFVFEVMRGMNIHAMQYALVGFALVLFFLLLISLSEHIGFLLAYWIASISCIGLITYYMHSVLKDKKLSLSFAGLLALLYITLYILLNGEEYSLLLGTILLFLAISATMILTRNVDWYALSQTHSVIKRRKVEENDHEN